MKATHLEDAFGQDLSSSPLWSAFLLDSEEGCKAILQTHLDFLRAGADIISTSSYQVSRLAYQLAEQSPTKADEVLKKSVELAYEAIQQFIASDQSHRNEPPLLLLSLGPYGAALANGSECTYCHYGLGFTPRLTSLSLDRYRRLQDRFRREAS